MSDTRPPKTPRIPPRPACEVHSQWGSVPEAGCPHCRREEALDRILILGLVTVMILILGGLVVIVATL